MTGSKALLCLLVLNVCLWPEAAWSAEWTAASNRGTSQTNSQSEIVLIQHERPMSRLAAPQYAEPRPIDLESSGVVLASAEESQYVYLPESGPPAVVMPTDSYAYGSAFEGGEECYDEPEQRRESRIGVFGEFLYLRPRDADVAYAVPQDGIGFLGATPMGQVAKVDQEFAPGIRLGAFFKLGPGAKIVGTYTWYESSVDGSVSATAPLVINPLVMYPGTFNAGFTAQEASATHSLDFQHIDLDYEVVSMQCNEFWVGYTLGARYSQFDQSFSATFPFAQPDGTTTVSSAINFDGIGVRGGLRGERVICPERGFRAYGKGIVSLLAGEFSSSYVQQNEFNGVEVNTGWTEERIVPIVDLEAGLVWVGPNEHFRISGGYMVSAWYNTVTTPVWIQGVQQQDFSSLKDHITFDGLVARAEVRY